jgi:hypothetical protein
MLYNSSLLLLETSGGLIDQTRNPDISNLQRSLPRRYFYDTPQTPQKTPQPSAMPTPGISPIASLVASFHYRGSNSDLLLATFVVLALVALGVLGSADRTSLGVVACATLSFA